MVHRRSFELQVLSNSLSSVYTESWAAAKIPIYSSGSRVHSVYCQVRDRSNHM